MPSAPTGMPTQLRAHAGQQVLQPGVDGIFDRHRIAGAQQHAADQVERLLAAVGDEQVVAGTGQPLPPRLLQQVAAQRFVAAGRTELQDVGEIGASQHRRATGAKLIQRETARATAATSRS